jgi:hypothetical protein
VNRSPSGRPPGPPPPSGNPSRGRRGRVGRWVALPARERRLTLEATLLLAASWGAVRLLPFRWYAPLLGRQERPSIPGDAPHPAGAAHPDGGGAGTTPDEEVAREVGRSLRRGARHLPWHSTCLMQAMAGKMMLRRRGCEAIVYFGVGRGADAGRSFHAWLRTGAVWVSGEREAPGHVVLSVFH